MKKRLLQLVRRPEFRWLKQAAFLCRGIFYLGNSYWCPCCGWPNRGFLDREGVFGLNEDGYCPRCNAKARHRRDWLYLKANTNLFTDELRLLEVAPCRALARQFRRMPNLQFLGLDLDPTAVSTTVAGDVAAAPLDSEVIDAVVCIHVLEHVNDDRAALEEIFRVLRPGGWALVSVPLLSGELTREDPAITAPEDRERMFGEKDHVRYYGTDFIDRLEGAGFEVDLNPSNAIQDDEQRRYGLRFDENVFHCVKPAADVALMGKA